MIIADDLIEYVIEQIALDGAEGSTIERLWILIKKKIGDDPDDYVRNTIWSWLLQHREKIKIGHLTGEDTLTALSTDELESSSSMDLWSRYGESLRVFVSEDILWRTLTGFSQQDTKLGKYPFALLCAITRAREEGLTAIDAARITNQDPRSLFSRVNVLIGLDLIKKYPIILKKVGKTTLLVNSRFVNRTNSERQQESKASSSSRDMSSSKIRQEIISTLKASTNGIRQRADLRQKLGMSADKFSVKRFMRCLRSLEEIGCIRRVLVIRSSDASGKKYDCVQYVKDFPEKAEKRLDDSFNDVADEYEIKSDPDEVKDDDDDKLVSDAEDGDDNFEIREDDKIQQLEEVVTQNPTFNRYFPFENQIYDVTNSRAEKGVSSMELNRLCAGINFSRILYSTLSKLSSSAGSPELKTSQPRNLGHYALVRGSDNSARVNYYRYFTLPNYRSFMGQTGDENWGLFSDIKSQNSIIDKDSLLRKAQKTRILPLIGIGEKEDGTKIPVWHGMGSAGSSINQNVTERSTPTSLMVETSGQPSVQRKRGRPRKDAIHSNNLRDLQVSEPRPVDRLEVSLSPEAKQNMTKATEIAVETSEDAAESPAMSSTGNLKSVPQSSLKFIGTKNGDRGSFSLAALHRQTKLLELLDKSGGVMEGGRVLREELQGALEGTTTGTIDRKTMERDIASLENKSLIQRICLSGVGGQGPQSTVWIIAFPNMRVDSPEVVRFREALTEKKTSGKRSTNRAVDVIYNDFSFFHLAAPKTSKARERVQKRAERTLLNTRLTEEEKRTASERLRRRADQEIRDKRAGSLMDLGSIVSAKPNRRAVAEKTIVQPLDSVTTQSLESTTTPKSSRKRQLQSDSIDPMAKYTRQSKKIKYGRSKGSKDSSTTQTKGTKVRAESGRRIRMSSKLGQKQADNIYRAVIIVRSFYGGLAKTIDWEKVAESLGEPFKAEVVHSFWPRVRYLYGGSQALSKASERWEHIFIEGYESGAFPDFDIRTADIRQFINYWREHDVDVVDDEDSVNHMLKLQNENKIREYSFVQDEYVSSWLDGMRSSLPSIKIEEHLTSVTFSCPEESEAQLELISESDNLEPVKQLIKSIIATEEAKYDPKIAKNLLDSYGQRLCAEAVAEMEKERIITYTSRDLEKRVPGRNFVFADKFNSLVKLRTGDDSLKYASLFHNRLRHAFEESKGIIMSRVAPDSSMICLMDLIAREEVDLVRVNVNKGKLIEGYTSRLVDRDKLDCDIVLRSNAANNIPELPKSRVQLPVVKSADGKPIPGCRTWVDIFGSVNTAMFIRLANAIVVMIALRPSIQAKELYRNLQCIVTIAELRDILDWLLAKGCIEIRSDMMDGYTVRQGWYCTDLDLSIAVPSASSSQSATISTAEKPEP
ncbi:hypothetical protein V1511DRAFT_496726 [Dipodascopsis uninucleata]